MANETYTFKEILFGLRNEYLEITKKINILKNYLLLEENNIESINLHLVHSSSSEETSLICFLYERKNKLKQLIEKLMRYLDIYPSHKMDYIKEQDNNFVFLNYPKLIKESKQEAFNQTIIDIYNMEFIQNIENIFCGNWYELAEHLSVLPNDIYVSKTKTASIDYDPTKGDFLHIESLNKRLTREDIEACFNTNFPKSDFSKYYQSIIESSISPKKPIDIIGEIDSSKKVDLEIIEDSKRLILRKK